ncbi:MAG: hypothetical protein L7S45_04500 [Luminiphilus sp.]|nr:hypothetical protein [Luminiphilus sp.]
MSQAQAFANHSMYMASVVLDVWAQSESDAALPANAVIAAFAPAVKLHLLDAYGWFLLALRRESQLPRKPPHSTLDLSELPAGIEQPPEVKELQLLEQSGWLSALIAPIPLGMPARQASNVLVSEGAYPDLTKMKEWRDALESLLQRQADAIEES